MGFTIFRASELDWVPRDDGSGRAVSGLSDSMTHSWASVPISFDDVPARNALAPSIATVHRRVRSVESRIGTWKT